MGISAKLKKLEAQYVLHVQKHHEVYELREKDGRKYVVVYRMDDKAEQFVTGERLWTDPPVPEHTQRTVVAFIFKQ